MLPTNQKTDNAAKWQREAGLEARLLARYRSRLLQQLRPLNSQYVLDVGCGEGLLTSWLAERLDEATVHGLEARPDAVAEFSGRNPELPIHQGDLYALPFDDSAFDLVVCLEVLEHLDQPQLAVQELRRVAARHVVVTVPLEPVFRLGNLARGRYRSRLGSTPGHVNTWGPVGFRRLLSGALPNGRWFELGPWQGYVGAVDDAPVAASAPGIA